MPTKATKATTGGDDGFSAEERAAMKQRAREVRRRTSKATDGLQDLLDAVAKMAPADRALAEQVHAAVTRHAPHLAPKTWYGMPAYANAAGKVVVFFQDAGKFKYRYCTLGFQDAAALDDGDLWPVAYALTGWGEAVEARVAALLAQACAGE